MAARASAWLVLWAGGLVSGLGQQSGGPGIMECLTSAGFRGLSGERLPWSGTVSLTVAATGDASNITIDSSALPHAKFIVLTVLPQLRFRSVCAGKRLSFSVHWEPTPDGRYGMTAKQNELIVTGYSVLTPSRLHGGPLEITTEDLEALRRSPSIKQFLREKGMSVDP